MLHQPIPLLMPALSVGPCLRILPKLLCLLVIGTAVRRLLTHPRTASTVLLQHHPSHEPA